MKKYILIIALGLPATASWAIDVAEAKVARREAEAQRIEKDQLLSHVASAASQFARHAGCAPGAPSDLVGKPSADRMRALGCKPGVQVNGEYLPPSLREAAKRLAFVRRWDGLMVIEYAKVGGSKDQCTFLDAEHSKCELG